MNLILCFFAAVERQGEAFLESHLMTVFYFAHKWGELLSRARRYWNAVAQLWQRACAIKCVWPLSRSL